MYRYNLLLAFLLIFTTACKPDDDGMQLASEPGSIPEYMVDDSRCDFQLGQALITQRTRDLMPYADGEELIFADSLGNTITFTVSEGEVSRRDVVREIQIISNGLPDTVYRCSGFEEMTFGIRSNDIGVYFVGFLKAGQSFYQTLEGDLIGDGVTILMGYEENENASLAFRQSVNRGNSSLTLGLLNNPSVTIFDRTFPNVSWISEEQQLSGQPRYLRYSFRLGIIFFRDGTGKMWRLENRR